MEARFDGIYTGFAADEEQIGHMIHIAETFHKKKAFLLVDPIMGDHGYKFDIFSIEFCRKMRELADVYKRQTAGKRDVSTYRMSMKRRSCWIKMMWNTA